MFLDLVSVPVGKAEQRLTPEQFSLVSKLRRAEDPTLTVRAIAGRGEK